MLKLILFCSAFGSALVGLFGPAFTEAFPEWLRFALLAAGLALMFAGIFFGKSGNNTDGISVKMRDGNTIGRIGNDHYDK